MNKIYITSSGKIMLGDNNQVIPITASPTRIDDVIQLTDDVEVYYKYGETECNLTGKAGDILITFYEKDFPNKAIIVSNELWKENLDTYKQNEQKRKEEWAAKGDCCENEK